MAYLLDTSTVSAFFKGDRVVLRLIESIDISKIFVSTLTIAEIYYGVHKSNWSNRKRGDFLKNFEEFLGATNVENFNTKAARIFGKIKSDCYRSGNAFADIDLQIAAIAISKDFKLISLDSDFAKINGLKLQRI